MTDTFQRLRNALADRYRLERELGRGGMATVYLARDLKHEREVAVKVLRPDLAAALGGERFLREIQIAAKLNHPHILPLHDSGEAAGFLYYVMPYVTGETLRDRLNREAQLPIEDAVQVAREVADGLSHAHTLGVIHRDIKPANILLSAGHAVISDFGIAQAVTEAGGKQLTETGLAIGTAAYMSPEQAAANTALDGRSDIYSLGCVLYEMLGGEPPFTGPSAHAIVALHQLELPRGIRTARPSVPEPLESATLRALAKLPADRHPTAAQLRDALAPPASGAYGAPVGRRQPIARRRPMLLAVVGAVLLVSVGVWWGVTTRGGSSGRIESLAVLPFANLMGPEEEYFVDGMHDRIIGELAQISALTVISRTSVLSYKDTDKPMPQIARELGVDVLVEGSVFRAGDTIRINAQLIAFDPERHLWAQMYDGELKDVLEIHSRVAQGIAHETRVVITPGEQSRLATVRQVDTAAYEAYSKGTFFINQFTPETIQRGLQYLNEAVALDPADPLAWTGLARGYLHAAIHAGLGDSAYRRARTAAERALALDETVADAHAVLGEVHQSNWDWQAAEREYERAIALNPNSAAVRHGYGVFLEAMARPDEALEELRRAQQLDPLSAISTAQVAVGLYQARRYEEAAVEAEKALELQPDMPPALWVLGEVYKQLDRLDEAVRAHERAMAGSPGFATFMGHTYVAAGQQEAAVALLDLWDQEVQGSHWAFGRALTYAGLGETDRVFDALEAMYEQRHPYLYWIRVAPHFDDYRSDPRYDEMVRRMNFPPP